MKLSVFIATAVAALCMASIAIAGTPPSTSQTWTFSNDAMTNIAPDSLNNIYGIPTATVNDPGNGSSTGWWDNLSDVYGSAQGWWDIGTGSIVLDFSNLTSSLTQDLSVKVTYWQDLSQAPDVQVSSAVSSFGKTTTKVANGPVGGAWYTDEWLFNFGTGDSLNTITFLGDQMMGTQIDNIVVNTTNVAAVPEPSSLLAVVMIGGPTLLFFRRRRA